MPNPAFAELLSTPVPGPGRTGVVDVRCPPAGPYAVVLQSIVDTLERHGLVVRLGGGSPGACGAILAGEAAGAGQAAGAGKAGEAGPVPAPYPVVVVGERPPADGVAAVWSDRDAAARALRAHLYELGHRRIAAIGESGPADGFRAAHELLDLAEPPTALVCRDEIVGGAALRAVRERGAEVAVAAFDDAGLGPLTPPALIVVRRPWAELGGLAAAVLLRLLDAPGGESPRVAVPAEIARESAL
jgi:hypothetical protein